MPKDLHTGRYRIEPGHEVHLSDVDPNDTSGFEGKDEDEQKESKKLNEKLGQLQEMLYAEHEQKVLVILQAMDTGGKDGVINRVFKESTPKASESHISKNLHRRNLIMVSCGENTNKCLERGELTIFNRSHYEGVLVERVHKIVSEEVWSHRYRQINDFERILSEEDTTILKFYLYIDKDEQKKRLQQRLDDPSKRWKFSGDDLPERKFWKEYMKAYEDALNKTSTEWAPWHLIPANHKWYRDLVVSRVIMKAMEKMNLHYPKTKLIPGSIIID